MGSYQQLVQGLLEGIAKALQARDFDAVRVLLTRLAVVDPVSAQAIYDLIQVRAQRHERHMAERASLTQRDVIGEGVRTI